jgi:hypothetical protein
MMEIYELLQQKEADLAHVRKQIEDLRIVEPLLSKESLPKDAFELLQQKEACVTRVRREIESLQIVAPLLSEELASHELTSKAANSTEETSDGIHGSEATGTDGIFSSFSANSRPKLWRILKGKT